MSDRRCEWPGCRATWEVSQVVGTGSFYCVSHGRQRARELAKEKRRELKAKRARAKADRLLHQGEHFVRDALARVERSRLFDLDDE